MTYLSMGLPLTTMIVCPWGMVGKGTSSGIPLVSSKKDAFTPFKQSFFHPFKKIMTRIKFGDNVTHMILFHYPRIHNFTELNLGQYLKNI